MHEFAVAPLRSRLAVASGPRLLSLAGIACAFAALLGCTAHSPGTPTATPTAPQAATQHVPARPTIPPPPFKLFHQESNALTLVTDPNATDDQVAALLWQLRDAAHTHTFDRLHLSQKLIDARAPIMWFHIYRGPKCASEKYTEGPLPCGGSYHAAGDYTYGGYRNREWDNGVLLHPGAHETALWNPDAPYTPPGV